MTTINTDCRLRDVVLEDAADRVILLMGSKEFVKLVKGIPGFGIELLKKTVERMKERGFQEDCALDAIY